MSNNLILNLHVFIVSSLFFPINSLAAQKSDRIMEKKGRSMVSKLCIIEILQCLAVIIIIY